MLYKATINWAYSGSDRATCFAASDGGRESFSPLITINWLQRLPEMPCYGNSSPRGVSAAATTKQSWNFFLSNN